MASLKFAKKIVVVSTLAMLAGIAVIITSSYIFLVRVTFIPKFQENTVLPLLSTIGSTGAASDLKNIDSRSIGHLFLEMMQNGTNYYNVTVPNSTDTLFQDPWIKFKTSWRNSMSFVLLSTGIVFFVGLLQFFAAATVVICAKSASNKTLSRLTTYWILVNVIIFFTLIICTLSNMVMDSDVELISSLTPDNGKHDHTFMITNFVQKYFMSGVNHSEKQTWTNDVLDFLIIHIYNVILALDILLLFVILFYSALIKRRHGNDIDDDEEDEDVPSEINYKNYNIKINRFKY